MSLYLYRDWMNDLESMRPSSLLDQNFGLGLSTNDFLRTALMLCYYMRPWRLDKQDTGSTVHYDKDRFQVNLDVQQFLPDEIQVKVVDNSVVVEGKHEEKQDEHGYISRHFIRRYQVPKEYKLDAVASSLSTDGVLTISAPRVDSIEAQEKVIPITKTGSPHKPVKDSKEQEQEQEKKQ